MPKSLPRAAVALLAAALIAPDAHAVGALQGVDGGVSIVEEQEHGLPGCYRCGVDVADFDGDGRIDLVMAGAFDSAFTPDQGNYTYENAVRLYRNVSQAGQEIRFELQQEVPDVFGGGGALVEVGDYDGDGGPDFAVQFREGESASDTASFMNEGDWRFTRRVLVPGFDTNSTSLGMAAADIDQDGRDDLIFSSDGYGAGPGLWYRWEEGAWQAQQTDFIHAIAYGGAIAAGDLNGDGFPDLVVGGNASVPFGAYDCSSTLLYGQIHLNRGATSPGIEPEASSSLGRFALRSDRDNPPVCTGMDNAGLLIADVDLDGTNDIIIAGSADAFNGPPGLNGSHYDFVVLRNVDGSGDNFVTFEHAGVQFENGTTNGGTGSVDFPNIAVGDLTGDGFPEVFLQGHHRDYAGDVGSYVFDTRFFLNVGGTEFTELELGLPDVSEGGQAMADFNGDGLVDLLFTGASIPFHSNGNNPTDQNDASTLSMHVYRNTRSAPGEAAATRAPTAVPGGALTSDPDAVATPPPLDRPAVGGSVADPIFGPTIRRVSDRSEAGDGSFEVQLYSQLQAFSADNAYLLLANDAGYLIRRVSDFGEVTGLDLREVNVPRWHPTQPGTLVHFDTNADADVTVQFTDVATGLTTDVATLPDLVRIDHNPSFEELSRDGRWFAGLAYRADDSVAIFAWDMIDGAFGAYLPLADLYSGPCEPDPQSGEVWPDWIAPSPLGEYLVVQWARDGTERCSGLETFALATGAFVGRVADGNAHGDLGVSADGREFFMTYELDHPTGNASIAVRWLPGEETVSEPNYVLVLGDWVDGYISCQGPPGVCLVTLRSNPDNGWQPLEGELVLLSLDGSVRRLVHHRSSDCGYWSQPRATLSRDGSLVAFSSDWGVAACTPANDGLGNADPYVLVVPASRP